MKLKNLLKGQKDYKIYFLKEKNPYIEGISSNSKQIKPGFIFVAIKGKNLDGNDFVEEAIENGAKIIISENLPSFSGISWIRVKDAQRWLFLLLDRFYGYPTKKVKIVGITGTNGKTTVSYLLERILKAAGYDCGVIGTINYRYKSKVYSAVNTTPSCETILHLINKLAEEKIKYLIMEVSSHALDQRRIEGFDFSSAIFTNLSSEHLDYHKTKENYFQAKLKLFKQLKRDNLAIINNDDSYARRIRLNTKAKVITYGIKKRADFMAERIRFSLEYTEFYLKNKNLLVPFKIPLIGEYNVYNILASLAWGIEEGVKIKILQESLEEFKSPPGRLEKVGFKKGFYVFVDYAHTDKALRNVLSTLRRVCSGRIILVFGCGGDRDRKKRPRMGRVATELSDFVFITSDNPRSEDPIKIIQEIKTGIKKDNFRVIPDRYSAIKEALLFAKPKDIVLVAGKGHEQQQIFKDKIIPFDDRQIIRECLRLLN